MNYWILFAAFWLAAFLVPQLLLPNFVRRVLAVLFPFVVLGAAWMLGPDLTPWQRLALTTVLLLYAIKASVLLTHPAKLPFLGRVVFMTVWPGMDPSGFLNRTEPSEEVGANFVTGLLTFYLGLTLILLVAWHANATWAGWIGLAALLLTIHLGYAQVLRALLQLAGWNVELLFNAPLRSNSLQDFWTRRWNLAFVEMDRALFLKPLARKLGTRGAVFGVFILSGLFHEIAISYPVNQGWGTPLLYFILQGLAVLLEHRWKIVSRVWTWSVLLLPLPLLFHEPFRIGCILPLFTWLQTKEVATNAELVFDKLLWVMGAAHFCVFIASFQVPTRLKWKEDLAKLTPFNRKLMWTYGVFIVFCILAFGVMTLALHRELLLGTPAALGIAIFIASFWALRVIVDAVVFTHDDWPPGPYMKVGHALLTSLFVFLVGTYGGLVIWHLR